MGFADAYDAYLQKHAIRGRLVTESPDPQLYTIIAIPATNESGLTTCLDSLFKCDPPVRPAEVVVLINSARSSSEEIVAANRRSYEEVREWIGRHRTPRHWEERQNNPDFIQQDTAKRDPAMSQQQENNQGSRQHENANRGQDPSEPQEKLRFHVVLVEDLPDKHFGAGLARKLVMDEAVRRLAWAAEMRRQGGEQPVRDGGEADKVKTGGVDAGVTGGTENGSTSKLGSGTDAGQSREQLDIQKSVVGGGIIVSLDADTVVRRDYLRAVEDFFEGSPEMEGCSISFEHPLNQQEYNRLFYKPNDQTATPSKESRSDQQLSADHISRDNDYEIQLPPENFPPTVFDAVTNYELHQRYYLQAVRHTGYPNAYHTVGSCFAVRAETYCRMGGMSRRKAGEDFYFIQKIAMHGRYGECRTTLVYPSPRPSDRVPFGTGPDISRQIDGGVKLDASAKHPNDRDSDGAGPDREQPADGGQLDASVKNPNDRDSDGAGPDTRQLPPYLTYHPDLFEHLRIFFALIPRLYR
ncbi:MAG: hypothetical protein LC655_00745, partial [Bacteroidales bacterium]|nr:hypothetical protein [Bacteroidales bacterium]